MPDEAPTLTTVTSPDTHVPPEVALDNAEVVPEHRLDGPDIAPGVARTFMRNVLKHEGPIAYVMVTEPAETPVTFPPDPTVAFPLLALQDPPAVEFARV